MAVKKAVKKPVTKKPVAKKQVAKKPAVKKPAAKKPAAKKPVAKKSAAKKPVVKKPAKRGVTLVTEKKIPNRVAPKIAKRPSAPSKPQQEQNEENELKARQFAYEAALKLKAARAAADKAAAERETTIRLSKRPTTRAQGKTTEKFPAADIKEFRKRLQAAREQALSGVDSMKATGFNESEDHEADGGDGTNQTLRLQALGQIGVIKRTLQQIDEAMHRIDDGTYGVCKVCGQLIRKPRLLNQPFVLTCMECQNDMESGRIV